MEWDAGSEAVEHRAADRAALAVLRLCWSCGEEVPSQPATCGEAHRPMHWYCPDCEVRWSAHADRIEEPEPVMAAPGR